MRSRHAALLALVVSGSLSVVATAAPKKPAAGGGKAAPACGAKVLPLVVGNQWTYNLTPALVAAQPAIAKLAPMAPKSIVVDVMAIDLKGADTVVAIREKLHFDVTKDEKKPKFIDRELTGTVTCNAKGKFDISPELTWFAGEPGGYQGLAFDKFDRKKETSLKLTAGAIGEEKWTEEIAAHWTQIPSKDSGATLQSGTLELERAFIPQEKESVTTKMGQYLAEKLALTTTGRITLDKPLSAPTAEAGGVSKPSELPAEWINTIWLVEGVGVVQTLNQYAHQYTLVDAQLK